MDGISLLITLILGAFLIALPRHLAAIPLLMGASYVTRTPVLEIGPASLTEMRILVVIGIIRVLSRGERVAHGLYYVDILFITWAALLVGTSFFHTYSSWVLRVGMVWNDLGCYFLFRVFIRDVNDIQGIFRALCVILVPVAILMLLEKATDTNLFSIMGDVHEIADIRHGHVRARGPFNHPILAGTVGATCFPMALYLWHKSRLRSLMGLFAGGGIVFASTSSGPIMMLGFILFSLVLWNICEYLRTILWCGLAGVVLLDAIMKDPVYFLVARIDLSGGSTGWHRARLIQSSIEHIDEWWLLGTDYTRHWMPTGILANSIHTDITNHLLTMGVMGGLPLMFAFIMVLVAAFRAVGRSLHNHAQVQTKYHFLIWMLGAILAGHVWNFFSIVLYDQSITFLYLILASIGAVRYAQPSVPVVAKPPFDHFVQWRYATAVVDKAEKPIASPLTENRYDG